MMNRRTRPEPPEGSEPEETGAGTGDSTSPRNRGSDPSGTNPTDAAFVSDFSDSIVDTLRHPLLVLDGDLRVERANRAFYEAFRVSPADTLGRRLRDLGNGQWDIPALHALLRETLARQTQVNDYRVDHEFPALGRRAMMISAGVIYSANRASQRILVEIEDITRRLQAEEPRNRLAAIVKSSEDAIISKDLNGVITTWNVGAERLFGYTAAEAIGKPVSVLIPSDREDEEPKILDKIRHGESVEHYETVRRRKDGSMVDISLSVSPIVEEDGRIIGASKIARDITQQKVLEASLYESSRRTKEFIAVLAHELRNPLAPIRNALQILSSRGERDSVVDTSIDMMQRQMRLVVRLVDDLLDVSRISRGKIELRRDRVDLNALVREIVDAARALIQCQDQEISVATPDEPLYLRADPARIAQVVGNIVNNACKFTGEGGRILVTVERVGSDAVVRVKDNGIGIAPEKRAMIFEMFAQLDTSLERVERGLGIGLSLAKSLVELHDGTIDVHSDGLGHGSEFVVRIPIDAADLASSAPSPVRVPALSGRRILVVDDNHDSATSLAILLQMMGNETQTAYDGHAAFDTARAFQPELILLDIGLPRMNGYDVCRRIRQESWGQGMTIVALTGWGQKEDVRKSIEAGFNGHLVKPVELSALTQLLSEVEEHTGGKRRPRPAPEGTIS